MRKKSLGLLTQNFAKLFLTMEVENSAFPFFCSKDLWFVEFSLIGMKSVIQQVSLSSLDEATRFLLGEGHEEYNTRS